MLRMPSHFALVLIALVPNFAARQESAKRSSAALPEGGGEWR